MTPLLTDSFSSALTADLTAASTLVVDLHAHSHISDGTLAPAELVARAYAMGVQLFALTDHDELSGLDEAAQNASALGLAFVPGVEISVTWNDTTLHIVGLNVDASNAQLCAGLEAVRAGRLARGRTMAEGLAQVGIRDALQGALEFADNPNMLSRTHFARWLVATGRCSHVREVFKRYLTPGKPGYVPHAWATLSEAVNWIRAAGGVAVLAHPGRYAIKPAKMRKLVLEFQHIGGEAIEVATSNHSAEQVQRFTQLALEFNLEGSRGSDFHGPNESHAELGRAPQLPAALTPVWHRFLG